MTALTQETEKLIEEMEKIVGENEVKLNVIESTSTDNLVFSGDEFNIRTDNREFDSGK
jgi:hypothetical protein